MEDGVLVTEYYEMPSAEYKNGRLLITCGDMLLYEGELPYQTGENGERRAPFVRQVSLSRPGCFWGMSIIERCIPIQRAYNAVKNRKHEFLNRAAVGVLAVEEGSVDLENLELEGLAPANCWFTVRAAIFLRFCREGICLASLFRKRPNCFRNLR